MVKIKNMYYFYLHGAYSLVRMAELKFKTHTYTHTYTQNFKH